MKAQATPVLSNLIRSVQRISTVACLAASLTGSIALGVNAQPDENVQPVDTVRFKEVHDSISQLKKLRNDLGSGHPRVLDVVRDLKLLEEKLRSEQSYAERLASQLMVSEDELRQRQNAEWQKLQAAEAALREQELGQIPSVETIELLERSALTELQRIDWELASERAMADGDQVEEAFQADELRLKALRYARDLAELKLKAARDRQMQTAGKGQESANENKLAAQILALELNIAEAFYQAAEWELRVKKRSMTELPKERIKSLQERRAAVESQLKSLPAKKDLARQLNQVRQSHDEVARQIRELEMARFQHQAKSVENQTLLELVRQALSPMGASPQTPSRASQRGIN